MQKIINLLFLITIILSYPACNRDTDPPSPSNKIELSGRITSRSGQVLSGVLVETNGITTTTDVNGVYRFKDLSVSDKYCNVTAKKTGYFDGNQHVNLQSGRINNLNFSLISNQSQFQVTSTQQQDIYLSNGAGLQLKANSVQTQSGGSYAGNVHLAVVHLNPDDSDFVNIIPGGDLAAQNSSGNTVQLTSYGMLMVKMTDDSGSELEIASGKTATIKIPVPASMKTNAPITIPLWHFDEAAGIWKEEGSATKQGDFYEGTVSHFSSWNCDYPTERGTVKGRILDCNGNPLQNVKVKIGQVSAHSDEQGYFERYVPSGVEFTVQVDAPEMGLSSTAHTVTPLNAGSTKDVGNIQVQCPAYLEGNIVCTSGTFSGYVVVEWQGGTITAPLNKTGTFKIPVPANGKTASVRVVNLLGASTSKTAIFPTLSGETANIGSFEVCPDGNITTYPTSFIANGDGYTNQLFEINAMGMLAWCKYSIADDQSQILTIGDNLNVIALVDGKTTGTWAMDSSQTNTMITLIIDSKSFVPYQNASLTISEYGGVGAAVKGSFSGEFIYQEYNSSTGQVIKHYITVSNGNFHVIRQPDE